MPASPAAGSAAGQESFVLLPGSVRSRDGGSASDHEDCEPAAAGREPVAVIVSPVTKNVSPGTAPVAIIASPKGPPFASLSIDDCEPLVRRETGKEQVVQVHHDEGVAIHIGPEPCVVAREGAGEASAGERTGQLLSRETYASRMVLSQ